jgi:hypothetical protein
MGGIDQRGPIERDESPPGEIVEVGVGIGLDRGCVLDAVGRNHGRAIAGNRGGDWEKCDEHAQRYGRDQSWPAPPMAAAEITALILRSEAKLRVSKDAPEGCARSAHAGAPFEAPSGRLRARGEIENYKGTTGAAFPTLPHSHSGPNVYAIRLAGQGATQGVGIIPQATLLFARCVSAPNFVGAPPVCSRLPLRLRRNTSAGSGPMFSRPNGGPDARYISVHIATTPVIETASALNPDRVSLQICEAWMAELLLDFLGGRAHRPRPLTPVNLAGEKAAKDIDD